MVKFPLELIWNGIMIIKLSIYPCQITPTRLLHAYTILLQQNLNIYLIPIMILFTYRNVKFSFQLQPTKNELLLN